MFKGSFRDGNDILVKPGDRVEYRFGQRRGVLVDAMHDGDAWVNFDDAKGTDTVKWKNLCKVPAWTEKDNCVPAACSNGKCNAIGEYVEANKPSAPRTILAFTGLAGSGKSTAAQYLVERHGFQRIRFAGPLKAMLAALGCTPEQIDGSEKETPCDLLGGKTPRHAMQTLGTEWGRDLITSDLWIRAWQAAVAKVPAGIPIVIDDCRFPNEAAAITAAGGILVRIERPGAGTVSVHQSEQHALPYVETLRNIADKRYLFDLVDTLVRDLSWRDLARVAA